MRFLQRKQRRQPLGSTLEACEALEVLAVLEALTSLEARW